MIHGRHVNDVSARQRDVRRNAGAFLANGFLGNLDQDFLTFAQQVPDRNGGAFRSCRHRFFGLGAGGWGCFRLLLWLFPAACVAQKFKQCDQARPGDNSLPTDVCVLLHQPLVQLELLRGFGRKGGVAAFAREWSMRAAIPKKARFAKSLFVVNGCNSETVLLNAYTATESTGRKSPISLSAAVLSSGSAAYMLPVVSSTTRIDPPLPVHLLRARSQLTEIRAADLRFTMAGAGEFLTRRMGLILQPADVLKLEDRTEGWATGLQLAALSMQGRPDIPAFIDQFSGSHHFVLEYLMNEVLARQDEEVQRFLLCTSILESFCVPLCDYILASPIPSSQSILATLERANLFLIPWWLIAGGIAFALLVSLVAGSFPAMRASRLDPIQALRHD